MAPFSGSIVCTEIPCVTFLLVCSEPRAQENGVNKEFEVDAVKMQAQAVGVEEHMKTQLTQLFNRCGKVWLYWILA